MKIYLLECLECTSRNSKRAKITRGERPLSCRCRNLAVIQIIKVQLQRWCLPRDRTRDRNSICVVSALIANFFLRRIFWHVSRRTITIYITDRLENILIAVKTAANRLEASAKRLEETTWSTRWMYYQGGIEFLRVTEIWRVSVAHSGERDDFDRLAHSRVSSARQIYTGINRLFSWIPGEGLFSIFAIFSAAPVRAVPPVNEIRVRRSERTD